MCNIPRRVRRVLPCDERALAPLFSRTVIVLLGLTAPIGESVAQNSDATGSVLLVPDAVWDGARDVPQKGFVVLLKGSRIEAVGRAAEVEVPSSAERVDLPGTTLIPGLIEGHSHLFLHPYNETLWDDQVLKEKLGFRMALAVAHARATLEAGDTTTRGLGPRGAGEGDAEVQQSVERGRVAGPH